LFPFQNFQTADGWIVVTCPKKKFWDRLVEALELPELATNSDFATFAGRWEARDFLLTQLGARFLEDTTEEWLRRLRPLGVPCGPVNSVAEALADPLVGSREMIVDTAHPRFGTVSQVASPVRVGPPGADRSDSRRAPQRNEDAEYILHDVLGYTDADVQHLREAGAFGSES
jgi:crotonobetainyl-CoA:carnitine CoA-transferase CaiB-like acyl-CoA transferase